MQTSNIWWLATLRENLSKNMPVDGSTLRAVVLAE
jgi:hypothetical protein